MFRNHVKIGFVIYYYFFNANAVYHNNLRLNIGLSETSKVIVLPGDTITSVHAVNISTDATSILFQAHSHIKNVTVSETKLFAKETSATGRNIGIVMKLKDSELEKQAWISNSDKDNISVLIIMSSLNSYDPIPGGCNMEFPTKIAPYLHIRSDSIYIYLEYQHASLGFLRNNSHPICSISESYLTYDIYVLFLEKNNFRENEYFENIKVMGNVGSTKDVSKKVMLYSFRPNTRLSFMFYPNIGVVYNVIAKYTVNGLVKESAYVPVAFHGCPFNMLTDHGCAVSYLVYDQIFLFVLSIYGFMVAFFGDYLFGADVFFHGFLVVFFITLILFGKYYTEMSWEGLFGYTIGISLTGGFIGLFLWRCLKDPLIFLLLNGSTLGFLLAATLLYSPIGNISVFANTANFWSIIATGVLFVNALSVLFPLLISMLGSAIVGSYVFLLFYDVYFDTRLSYIIMNIVRRTLSEKFNFAQNNVPFQTNDIIMAIIWTILSLLAIVFWGKKPFSNVNQISLGTHLFSTRFSCCGRLKDQNLNLNQHNVSQALLIHTNNVPDYQTF